MTAALPYASTYVGQEPYRDPFATALEKFGLRLTVFGVCCAPYIVWRIHPDYLFTISDAILCLCAGLLVLGRAVLLRPFGGLTPIWFTGLTLTLGGLLVSSLDNDDPSRWLIVSGQYVLAFAILPMLLQRGDRNYSIQLALALIVGVVVMELFGACVHYFTGASYTVGQTIAFDFITGAGRLGAFMADANANAAMIAMTLPFVLYLYSLRVFSTLVAAPLIAILVIGLLLSGSFTGFVSTTVAAFIYILVAGGRRLWLGSFALLALGATLLATGVVALPKTFQNRVALAIEGGDLTQAGTFVGRMEMIEEAWGMVDKTRLVGLGADQFRVHSKSRAPVHNMYLLMWTEGGIPALLGWVLMILVPLIAGAQCILVDRRSAGLVWSVAIAFIGFSMAAPHMYARNWVIPLVVAMSILFSHGRLVNTPFAQRS